MRLDVRLEQRATRKHFALAPFHAHCCLTTYKLYAFDFAEAFHSANLVYDNIGHLLRRQIHPSTTEADQVWESRVRASLLVELLG